MMESGMRWSDRSVVSWYGNGNHPEYAVQLYGHFVGVWISSNRQREANKKEGVTFLSVFAQACYYRGMLTNSRTTKSTFSASECRSNFSESWSRSQTRICGLYVPVAMT